MPLTEYLKPAGIRVHAGEVGLLYRAPSGGRIYVSKASLKGLDQNLWAILKMGVWELGLSIRANSIDTGAHNFNSRHYKGLAVDIDHVGEGPESWKLATLENRQAMRLYFWLRSAGFRVGERAGGKAVPGIIFGPVGSKYNPSTSTHEHHIHASLPAIYKRK